jgi:cell division protein FtsB
MKFALMNKLKEWFLSLPFIFRNVFFLTGTAFLVWMIFFDDNNFILQYQRRKELKAIQEKKKYYIDEIIKVEQQYHDLTTNKATQEKFARENYWMKKDNEDVFVFIEKEK